MGGLLYMLSLGGYMLAAMLNLGVFARQRNMCVAKQSTKQQQNNKAQQVV